MKKIILIAFLFSFFVVRSQENIPLYDGYGFEIKTSAELVLLDSKYKRVDIIYFDSDLQNHVKWNGTAFAPFSSGSWDHTITQNIVTDGTPHHIGTFVNPIGSLITNGLAVTSGSISIGTVPSNPGGGQEGDFLANGTTNKPEYYNGTSWVGFLLQSDLIDEDDMSSDSDTRPPSQQSVKAYVDTEIASGGNFQEDLNIVVVTENGVVTGAGDQKANIEALIADNTELWFPNGVYNLSGILDVGNVTNFKISGNRGARFVFSSQMGIQQTGAWDNVKIEGISIESTNTTTTSGGGDSLIYMDNQQCDDVLIKNVYLTAPNGSINGIKIRQEGATTANNVVIDGVFVENIGRMGFEYQNHVTVSGNDISRASGVVVKNSRFVNPGQQEFSMGTSFSGPMENLKVLNNYFQGCSNRAMEFLATQGAEVRGNYGVGNNDFFVFTNNAVVSALSNTNIVFSENTSMGLGTGGTDNKDGGTFRDVQGLIAHGNKIYDITGGIYLDNTDNVYWSDNIVDVHSYGALVTQNGPSNINMLGGRFKNTKTGNGLIRVNSDSPQWSMTDVDFFTADAAQIHVRFGGGATIGPELSNIDEYHGTVYSETHGGGGTDLLPLDNVWTGTQNKFNGRVGVGVDVFGGSRLGDSDLQSASADFQSVNFKDGSQNTVAAMFLNPAGTVLTVKGFDDSVMVTDMTSVAGVENTDDLESTAANTIEYTNGKINVFDRGVQDYPSASTPVATSFFEVLQNKSGATELPYWFGRYDGTNYNKIFSVNTAEVVDFQNTPTVLGVPIASGSDNSLSEADQLITVPRIIEVNSTDFSIEDSDELLMFFGENSVDFPIYTPTIQGGATAPKHAVNKETMDAAILASGGGSDDQTLAEVLNEGNSVGTNDIDLNTQEIIDLNVLNMVNDAGVPNLKIAPVGSGVTESVRILGLLNGSSYIDLGNNDVYLNSSTVHMQSLSGTGTEMVTVNAAGLLGRQAIPSGGGSTDDQLLSILNNTISLEDGGSVDLNAHNVDYDNTTSGLVATETQAAIDELAASTGNPNKLTGQKLKTGTTEFQWSPIDIVDSGQHQIVAKTDGLSQDAELEDADLLVGQTLLVEAVGGSTITNYFKENETGTFTDLAGNTGNEWTVNDAACSGYVESAINVRVRCGTVSTRTFGNPELFTLANALSPTNETDGTTGIVNISNGTNQAVRSVANTDSQGGAFMLELETLTTNGGLGVQIDIPGLVDGANYIVEYRSSVDVVETQQSSGFWTGVVSDQNILDTLPWSTHSQVITMSGTTLELKPYVSPGAAVVGRKLWMSYISVKAQ